MNRYNQQAIARLMDGGSTVSLWNNEMGQRRGKKCWVGWAFWSGARCFVAFNQISTDRADDKKCHEREKYGKMEWERNESMTLLHHTAWIYQSFPLSHASLLAAENCTEFPNLWSRIIRKPHQPLRTLAWVELLPLSLLQNGNEHIRHSSRLG